MNDISDDNVGGDTSQAAMPVEDQLLILRVTRDFERERKRGFFLVGDKRMRKMKRQMGAKVISLGR